MTFTRNETPMRDFSKTAKTGFARPEIWNVEIPVDNAAAQHATVMQNFVDSILDGTPLIAPGAEGMNSVEFANAALYSSWKEKTVELPLDAAAYEKELQEKIRSSKLEKKIVKTSDEDFTNLLFANAQLICHDQLIFMFLRLSSFSLFFDEIFFEIVQCLQGPLKIRQF